MDTLPVTPPEAAAESDALNAIPPEGSSWSSVNLAEAVPGVMTPLCASVWVPASELGLRAPFHAMGVLASRRRGMPTDPDERVTNAFFGRMAVRVDFLCEIGDLVPGQSGAALARDFFGFVPPGFVSEPSMRRLPAVLVRYPWTLLRVARRMRNLRAATDAWWRTRIAEMPTASIDEARVRLADAVDRFAAKLAAQAVVSACAIQPLHERLSTLAAGAGVEIADLLRGRGPHEEAAVLADLWAVSRDGLALEEFLLRHGYHCPGEGEVSSRAWREDPTPVRRLVDRYRAMDDGAAPDARTAEHERAGADAERRLLAADGPLGRARARVVLGQARRFLPLRGVGKVSYLQSIDVVRAAARRIGTHLVAGGVLAEQEDAFYLTADELTGELPADPAAVVARRRALRVLYQGLEPPTSWTGAPVANPARPAAGEGAAEGATTGATTLTGVGAAPGVVEGRVVVVTDPADVEVEIEDGDILVTHTTDPAWVSLMFLSAAVVVDIGGMLSHAAVVAREMAVPCVMNTTDGTRVLRTGDRVRVDGGAGTVKVIERSGGSPE